jgi:tRNA-specific 2-thiouridylase
VSVGAQVRAHGEEIPATAWADGDKVEVRLERRVRGVAPGQSVVLYDGTRVVGSATIAQATTVRATTRATTKEAATGRAPAAG